MGQGIANIGIKDLQLLDAQIKLYSGTRKFKKAIENKRIEKPGLNTQLFYVEGRVVHRASLQAQGRLSSASTKGLEKHSFIQDLISYLPSLGSVETYKVLDNEKGKGAIRTTEADFEISVTLHRKPVVEVTEDFNLSFDPKTLKPHIEEIASLLTASEYDLVVLKNNQITIQKDDGKQMSVKFTRKKKRLLI